MPIYEYSCAKCRKQFEVLVRTDADIPAKCPKCGAASPAKAFSTFAVSMASPAGSSEMCSSCPTSGGSSCASGGCPYSG
ncbi:MAG: zinc ribbon domain-containing protein [Lentisphaerales bacterium]|nr:MAG: zinc ribbon domain-containing protein [Lentisphaerales bacterium]